MTIIDLQQRLPILAGAESLRKAQQLLDLGELEVSINGDNVCGWVGENAPVYPVLSLSPGDGNIDYQCDCPLGTQEIFCEHCAMLALYWLKNAASSRKEVESGLPPGQPTSGQAEPQSTTNGDAAQEFGSSELLRSGHKAQEPEAFSVPLDVISIFLGTQSKEGLISILVEEASKNQNFLQVLVTMRQDEMESFQPIVARERARRYVEQLLERGFAGTDRQGPATACINQIQASEQDLVQFFNDLSLQTPQWVSSLAEDAISWLATNKKRLLKNKPELEQPMSLLTAKLLAIHLRACQQVHCAGDDLAYTLFDALLSTQEEDSFVDAPMRYQSLLGHSGVITFQDLCESYWRDEIAPAGRMYRASYTDSQRRILQAMEHAARLTKRFDLLECIHGGGPEDCLNVFHVCQFYERMGETARAIKLAEDNLHVRFNSCLKRFLAQHYAEMGRTQQSVQFLYDNFQSSPGIHEFKQLRKHCQSWIREDWPLWREKCLQVVRLVQHKKYDYLNGYNPYINLTLPLQMFMADKDWQSAWMEVADGSTNRELSVELAQQSWQEFPEKSWIELSSATTECIEKKNESGYLSASEHLLLISNIAQFTGQQVRYNDLLADLQLRHCLKIKLLAILHSKGLTAKLRMQAIEF